MFRIRNGFLAAAFGAAMILGGVGATATPAEARDGYHARGGGGSYHGNRHARPNHRSSYRHAPRHARPAPRYHAPRHARPGPRYHAPRYNRRPVVVHRHHHHGRPHYRHRGYDPLAAIIAGTLYHALTR